MARIDGRPPHLFREAASGLGRICILFALLFTIAITLTYLSSIF